MHPNQAKREAGDDLIHLDMREAASLGRLVARVRVRVRARARDRATVRVRVRFRAPRLRGRVSASRVIPRVVQMAASAQQVLRDLAAPRVRVRVRVRARARVRVRVRARARVRIRSRALARGWG